MKKALPWLLVLAVIAAAAIIKLHLLGIPLERDEGEYAYIARLLISGEPLYQSAFNAKLPGIYFFYALAMALFGQSVFGIHLSLLLLNAATTVLVFLLGRRLLDAYAGTIAAAAFAVLTLGKYTLAFNIEHLAIFLVLGGSLLVLRAAARGAGFLPAGLLFGLAFIAKQHAVFFVPFGAIYAAAASPMTFGERLRRTALFAAGAALPFLALCALFYAQGVFRSFWFWVVEYALRYCAVMTVPNGIRSFLYAGGKVAGCAPLVWIAAGAGLFAAVRFGRQRSLFLLGLSVASLLALSPGLYFRHHYFIFLFPPAALLVGAAARAHKKAATILILLIFGLTIVQERHFLFGMDPAAAGRAIYVNSPVVESAVIADRIGKDAGRDARVIVLGSEPQIYFYLKRKAPVSFIYMYPLLEKTPYAAPFQKRFLEEVVTADADYLIGVHINTSWFNWYVDKELAGPFFARIEAYQSKHYDVVGIADMISRDEIVYRWGSEAASYKPRSENYILLLKRRAA